MAPAMSLLSFLFFLSACAAPQVSPDPRNTLSAARDRFQEGRFQAVVQILEPSIENLEGTPWEAEARYLAGYSLFQVTCAELESCQSVPLRGFGFLSERQVSNLTAARDDFLAAGDLAPQAPFAPEAFYLAARTMDYGYLQLFDRALELYRWCFTSYPDTDPAANSRERYENILQKFKGISNGAHGE